MSMPSMPAIQGSSPPLAPPNTSTTTAAVAAATNSANVANVSSRAASAIDPTRRTATTASGRTDESAKVGGQPVDAKELASAIEKVQDFTKTVANELKFSIDEDSGQTVVKIVDTATDEVIRQIPSEEMLAIAQALDKIQGVLIKQKA